MKLEMARHPCLEVQDDVAFIANDIALERGMKKKNFTNAFFPLTILFLLFSVPLCGLVFTFQPFLCFLAVSFCYCFVLLWFQ